MPEPLGILISCEHGGNRVPKAYTHLFQNRKRLLASHRGFDAGSLQLARQLARALEAPLIHATVTRLLADLNRSPDHPHVFSEITRRLSRDQRDLILARHYFPYREAVEKAVATHAAHGTCALHLSVHSFTPVLGGKTRTTDIGLLYDPARRSERAWCHRLRSALQRASPDLRVHRNAPYRGMADGLTTALRRRFPVDRYVGIELEVNQRLIADKAHWLRIRRAITHALCEVLMRQA